MSRDSTDVKGTQTIDFLLQELLSCSTFSCTVFFLIFANNFRLLVCHFSEAQSGTAIFNGNFLTNKYGTHFYYLLQYSRRLFRNRIWKGGHCTATLTVVSLSIFSDYPLYRPPNAVQNSNATRTSTFIFDDEECTITLATL